MKFYKIFTLILQKVQKIYFRLGIPKNYFQLYEHKTRIFQNSPSQNLIICFESSSYNSKLDKAIMSQVTRCSESIQNVTLKNFNFVMSIKVISALKNITKLTISAYRDENDEEGTVCLPNLKDLKLINSILFVGVIDSQSIEILEIIDYDTAKRHNNNRELESTLLNNFLEKCINLKDLRLTSTNNLNYFLNSENFEFELVTLVIENIYFKDENFSQFLTMQKSSLKKLAISFVYPSVLTSGVIFETLNLVELEIDVGMMERVIVRRVISSTIKKLTIRFTKNINSKNSQDIDNHNAKSAVEKLISIFKSVEIFILPDFIFDTLLLQLHISLTNLRILKLKEIENFIFPIINFENLEFIEIDEITSAKSLESCLFFIQNCAPNLKTLKINSISNNIFTFKYFTIIICEPKLKEIYIGVKSLIITDVILDVLLSAMLSGNNLKILTFADCVTNKIENSEILKILLQNMQINFHQKSKNTSIINETLLGQIEKNLHARDANLKQIKKRSTRTDHFVKM